VQIIRVKKFLKTYPSAASVHLL